MSLLLLGAGDVAAVAPVLQTYAVWGIPTPVIITEDSARVVVVAATSLTEETT